MKEQKEKLTSLCVSISKEMKQQVKEEARTMKGKATPSFFIRKLIEDFFGKKNGQQN